MVSVDTDASPEQLAGIKEATERTSPMFDNVLNATPVTRPRETAKVTVPAVEPRPPPPPPPTRAAASIKVRSVQLLSGGRVAASGSLNRKATGRVKITFTTRVGHKTVTTAAKVHITKGRFSAKLRLPKLARAFKKAKLAVRYGGNSRVSAATKSVSLRRSANRFRAQ